MKGQQLNEEEQQTPEALVSTQELLLRAERAMSRFDEQLEQTRSVSEDIRRRLGLGPKDTRVVKRRTDPG